ncbi:ADP-ribosylation factor 4 [Platysternon megacephalum]|uniref:ADP-ribosylation factor 4 n=1 Tax=Platysternon megacephalum TaxID=55544 RepID=A0A4D9EW12_9SAUR|nr:ADP-ribosylation factor 4 [Platysternon megacephalum]
MAVDIPHVDIEALNKTDKVLLSPPYENMGVNVTEVKSPIKFQMKKMLCLDVTVKHEDKLT